MSVCPTTRTAELLAIDAGSDNVWSVYFAVCKVTDFLGNFCRRASRERCATVTQPAAPVQPDLVTGATLLQARPVRTYKTLAGVAR